MIIHLTDGLSTDVYDIDSFPYHTIAEGVQHVERGNKSYWDIICTFDIETTSVREGSLFNGVKWGFMYVWQFCMDGYVCMGRTWDEYIEMWKRIKEAFPQGRLFVCYVHNLQFEFQFFRNFIKIDDVFARKKRQVLKCTAEGVEYRCSYLLTNMSLDMFCQKQRGIQWYKQTGKFDYSKLRFPDSELSEEEILYCVCDVLGLWEGITTLLADNNCNLADVPMTSTGFVRKDYREKCLGNKAHMKRFETCRLTDVQYIYCSQAARGAIAGSNACNTGYNLPLLDSFDIKSSYPYQMATKYFPSGKFRFCDYTWGSRMFNYMLSHYCCIIGISFDNLKLKQWDTIPYISRAKCTAVEGGMCGNGKLYGAKRVAMWITEIDLRIICDKYKYDAVKVWKFMCAPRGMLSKSFREHLLEMFQQKTLLENGDKYLYDKYKNKINASFGMLLTDILHPSFIYQPNNEIPFIRETVEDVAAGLDKYYNGKNNFLSYQDGVWVLAHGRDSLVEGMTVVGDDIVQVDTDSVKTEGDYKADFDKLNDDIKANAERFDVKPYAVRENGEKVYLGIWEHEVFKKNGGTEDKPTYKEFRTLGAKKYCYKLWDDSLHLTVSGLGKEDGEKWLNEHGMKEFKDGATIEAGNAGRLTSYYNDLLEPVTVCYKGHFITVGSNIALFPGKYTFGVTDEWAQMISADWDVNWVLEDDTHGV